MQKKKKPYSKRSDLDKIKSNWTKTSALLKRRDWSMAIVRAATTVELTANYAIRNELCKKRGLEQAFVDSLLIWANGASGKMQRLLLPIFDGDPFQKKLRKIKSDIDRVNKVRNSIAHSSQFKKESTANQIVHDCREVIETIVNQYDSSFCLRDIRTKTN